MNQFGENKEQYDCNIWNSIVVTLLYNKIGMYIDDDILHGFMSLLLLDHNENHSVIILTHHSFQNKLNRYAYYSGIKVEFNVLYLFAPQASVGYGLYYSVRTHVEQKIILKQWSHG